MVLPRKLIGAAAFWAALALSGASANNDCQQSVACITPGVTQVISARSVNFASTGDQATIAVPSGITKFVVLAAQITNCSTTPILAQPAIYSAASAGGTNIVAAATVTAASAATILINAVVAPTALATALAVSNIYVNVTVANAGALTCDVYVTIRDLT